MKFVGIALVFVCTFGGLLVAMKFDMYGFQKLLGVIISAFTGEFIIIFGSACAAFIIANTSDGLKHSISYLSAITKPTAYSKEDYVELLSALFTIFKLVRTKGWLAIEQHIENPNESDLFGQFPKFQQNHHAIIFLCDYLRIISLGNEDPAQIGPLMDKEIAGIREHEMHPGHAIHVLAEGLPALGIVAAVLGIIKTMASISEPPEVLGKMIGSALVGTFLGVWLSYAFAAPISSAMEEKGKSAVAYYSVMQVAMIAFLKGAAPQVAVEFARKVMTHDVQPSFAELEEHLNELPSPGQ